MRGLYVCLCETGAGTCFSFCMLEVDIVKMCVADVKLCVDESRKCQQPTQGIRVQLHA